MRNICTILFLACELAAAARGNPPNLTLTDLDGTPRHPLDPEGKIASVLIFYWHDCPICSGYAPEIGRISASYTNFAVFIVQVDPELSREAATENARQYNLTAPVLLDPDHQLVKFAKATVTPEAVVIRSGGAVLYRGRIDDLYPAPAKKRNVVTRHDLRDALDAIAAGKPVQNKETKPVGCLIQSHFGK